MRTVWIALALIATGQAGAASSQATAEQPKIIVDGYGEVKTVPDIATIGYSLRGEGKTSDDAVRAMVADGERIERSLRSIDAGAEPRTSEVRVFSARGPSCKDDDYGNRGQLSQGPCAIAGYIATQTVTARTGAVMDAGTMVGLAARNGGYNVRVDDFGLSDSRQAKQQALALALADAQAKAAAIAQGSHLALGPILSISTVGQLGRDIVITGSRIPSRNLVSVSPVTVNLNAERITTSATVNVTYSIQR